jgi:diguanylate cyclase (GGDEF)-like protein
MRNRCLIAALFVLLLLLGVGGSVAAGNVVLDDESRKAALEFDAASSDVAARVRTEVRRVEDLSRSAQAFVRLVPEVTSRELRAWADDILLRENFPAVPDIAVVDVVDHEDLPAHIAKVTADAAASGQPATFVLDPLEPAAAYCLRSAVTGTPSELGFNLCPGASPEVASTVRSLDHIQMRPRDLEGDAVLSIGMPLYRTPGIPAPAEREASFIGLVGFSFDPTQLLRSTLEAHRGLEASLEFRDPDNESEGYKEGTFRTGAIAGRAESRRIDLGNGWRVVVTQRVSDPGLLANPRSRQTILGGAALSLLIVVLLYVLATGRARALRLVKVRTEQLQHQALHDSLTGLANRALLMDRIEQLLARSRRNSSEPACLFLDLDGFKNVNDSLGHEAGDLLLRSVATRLLGAVREADTIARIGGDEFVVLLDGATIEAAPELVAERLVDVLRQPFDVDGVESTMRVTASVGIATGVRPSGDDLLRDADFALYEAKGAGRNRLAVYRADMQSTIQHGVELEFDLRSALERGQLRLMYQPIYNLDDLSVDGFEALLRWQHPTLGLVMPDEFIPMLERTGHIIEVGRWVLHEACDQLARWRAMGSTATVSVNVAARQFDNGVLLTDVRSALAAAMLDPAALTVEITETSLMHNLPLCVEQLTALREMGVQVAIDDFGTGYSSLASLQRLPVDSLKIDRSFIAAMSEGSEARALVHTIVQLGRDLGLRTLAEGVETAEQMANLRGDHLTQAQGYLFAHPLEADEVELTLLGAVPAAHAVDEEH